MKTANFLKQPLKEERIHEGIGLCKHVQVFSEDDFSTPVRFLNYTVIPPNASFGLHKHENDNEVYIILEGNGTYIFNQEVKNVQAGDIMINEPFSEHSLVNDGESDMRLLVFEIYN
jgi:mannose-6-phosphate isomerase-like protein (cupin superfamily)